MWWEGLLNTLILTLVRMLVYTYIVHTDIVHAYIVHTYIVHTYIVHTYIHSTYIHTYIVHTYMWTHHTSESSLIAHTLPNVTQFSVQFMSK